MNRKILYHFAIFETVIKKFKESRIYVIGIKERGMPFYIVYIHCYSALSSKFVANIRENLFLVDLTIFRLN